MSTTVQPSLFGGDDLAWQRQRHRKRKPAVDPPAIPDGPCCARCAWWSAPHVGDPFGSCRALSVVTERIPNGPERGAILVRVEAQDLGYPWEPLATRAGFDGCAVFAAKASEVVA